MVFLLFSKKDEPITGQFNRDATELKPITIYDTIHLQGEPKIIIKENPVNEELLKQYKRLQDTLKQLDMYRDAITIRSYKEVYKDDNIAIEVDSKAQGYLTNQNIKYSLKPKKKFSLYTGIETTITTQPVYTGKLYLQSEKMIYSVGYNNEKVLSAGIAIKLF